MKTLGIHDKEAIAAMEAHVVSECKAVDLNAAFDDMLDECYSFEKVGGIFSHMSPSRVLREVDPIAYRCGCNDWADGEGFVEIGSDSYRSDDVDAAAEEFVDGLQSELADLEKELEELQAEEEPDANAIDKAQAEITRKQSAIEACESHAW